MLYVAIGYCLLLAVSIMMFTVAYEVPGSGNDESVVLRNAWHLCIVAFVLAALFAIVDALDVVTILAGLVALCIIWAMQYLLTVDPHPIVLRYAFAPMVLVMLAYGVTTMALPWVFYEVKHGVKVSDALLTLIALASMFCTYTPPGRWLWRKITTVAFA